MNDRTCSVLLFTSTGPTGFMYSQPASMPSNPLGLQTPPSSGHSLRAFSSFLPNATDSHPALPSTQNQQSRGFLQPPKMGHVNPFRQGALVAQTRGMELFGVGGGQPGQASFSVPNVAPNTLFHQSPGSGGGSSGAGLFGSRYVTSNTGTNASIREGFIHSSHIPSLPRSNADAGKPLAVKTHHTGVNNLLGRVPSPPPPPIPRQPSLMELQVAMGGANHGNCDSHPIGQQQQPQNNSAAPIQSQCNAMRLWGHAVSMPALSALVALT